jgi:hypothetical protein
MPTTKRETIILAAIAKLEAITGIDGLVVERNRSDAVRRSAAWLTRSARAA